MRFLTCSLPVAVLAVFASTFACTLMVSVDRDKIPSGAGEDDAGAGGAAAGGRSGSGGEIPGDGGAGNGGSATGGSATGGSATGGSDAGPVEGGACTTGSDCPGVDTLCSRRVCTAGACSVANTAAGTATTANVDGDCVREECDGNGAARTVDADDPTDDLNPCTADTCDAGANVHAPVTPGTSCGTNLTCSATGECVGCTAPGQCPGTDDDCQTPTCTSGTCGVEFTTAGTPTTAQTAGNCVQVQCDGSGGTSDVVADTDLPVDSDPCTDDVCTSGTVSNPPATPGTACGTGGTRFCDGAGVCAECVTSLNCPGSDTDCRQRTCTAGVCDVAHEDDGVAVTTQQAGDCRRVVCNGAGATRSANDDADLPDDQNLCTTDTCSAGAPSNTNVNPGTSCGTGLTCNGTGQCRGCSVPADCPGTDTECRTRTCTSGACGVAFTADGTPLASQSPGDCKEVRCDGSGNETTVNLNTDVPVDTNDCTANFCTAGTPSNPDEGEGFACSSSGGRVCDGGGACVACNIPQDCPGTDTECSVRTCIANACGRNHTAQGVVITAQSPGDCERNECDGNGSIVPVDNDLDLPDDSNDCTDDVCTAGAPSNPPKGSSEPCASGAGACDGAGNCVQ